MKNLKFLRVAGLIAGFAFFASQAKADTLVQIPDTNGHPDGELDQNNDDNFSFFTVGANDLLVTQLGAFTGNENNPGLLGTQTTSEEFNVSLYNYTTATYITTLTIASGSLVTNTATETTYGLLPTAITLVAGDEYVLTDFAGPLDANPFDATDAEIAYYQNESNPITTPYVRSLIATIDGDGGYIESGTGLTISGAGGTSTFGTVGGTQFYGGSGIPQPDPNVVSIYGGNMIYTVVGAPEPSSLAYLALGGAALFFALRRRRLARVRE